MVLVEIQRCYGWKDMDGMLEMLLLVLLQIPANVVHFPEGFIFILNISITLNKFSPGSPDVKSSSAKSPQKG